VQHLQAAIALDEKAAMQQYMSLYVSGRAGAALRGCVCAGGAQVGQVEAILEEHVAFDLHYYGE
jgi:hypothetical protein